MKLASYIRDGSTRVGVIIDETVVDAGFDGTMIELIENFDQHRVSIEALDPSAGVPIADIHLDAPVRRPGKIFAIGLNYADHVAESKMETPQRQVWFTKAQTSINGPSDPILIARNAPYVDYEVELVAVIGKRAKHVSADSAHEYVFGYCVGNDVTERMWQHAGPQWSLGKSFDTHAPIGPWITTADEVSDPHSLDIACFVNGERRQNSNTKNLIFNIWQQIEHLSGAMTLEPGDIIFTGTPGGVGVTQDSRVFLKPGDVVRCEISGLGTIEAAMAAEEV
jgi:2-keto-4-pentenoate hydratase/2-oxohepta-3-ene-1,7-dioic acid hydratase in catechol pathway